MKRVSKRILNVAGVASILALLVVQPAFAASKSANGPGVFRSLISKIIRALDDIQIRLPPG
jgi:hypothetical protein